MLFRGRQPEASIWRRFRTSPDGFTFRRDGEVYEAHVVANAELAVATGVPREVVNACCELAARALKSPLWQDVSGTTVGAAIEKTVGPITTKYANAAGARNDGQTRYAGVTAMLRRWLSSYGSSVKLVRC